jgi:hypothetical protein
VDQACEPLKALLHIMCTGNYNGQKIDSESVRNLFKVENMLASSWYQDRLSTQRNVDRNLWYQHLEYIDQAINKTKDHEIHKQLQDRRASIKSKLAEIESESYVKNLIGYIGADPAILS